MASRSDTELLTEHFGYPPVSLLDEIINSVNFLAERALHSIEQGLLGAPPASLGFRPSTSTARGQEEDGEDDDPARRHRDEVEAGVHQLETLLWASIDKNFDRFEIYVMRNILCLRPVEMQWMRLGHYEGLDFEQDLLDADDDALGLEDGGEKEKDGEGGGGGDAGKAQERLTVGSVNKLRRRLQASQRLHCMLVAEQARNAALLAEVKRLVGTTVSGGAGVKIEPQPSSSSGQGAGDGPYGQRSEQEHEQKPPLRFVHEKGDLTVGDAETPLTTTTAFMLSQMQALRELSTALRRELPALAAPRGEEDVDEEEDADGKRKSWRRERLEYVEKATRKHLENVRGLELGKNGEVRDGEWDGGGRSLAKGEVESLEQLVDLLGGGSEEQDKMDES